MVPLYSQPRTFKDADVGAMSSLFQLLAGLWVKGVRPDEVRRDQFPGKKPPSVAPKIPQRANQLGTISSEHDLTRAYAAFKKTHPKGQTPSNIRKDLSSNSRISLGGQEFR